MKSLLIAMITLMTSYSFATETKCTKALQIKTLEAHVQTELGEAYNYDKSKNALVAVSGSELTLGFEDGFIYAEGYVGECSGGAVWGITGVKTSQKVLENGLCEVLDTYSGGSCED